MGAGVAGAGSWRAGTLRRGEILLGILIFAARQIQIRRKCGDVSPTAGLIVAREKSVNVDTFRWSWNCDKLLIGWKRPLDSIGSGNRNTQV